MKVKFWGTRGSVPTPGPNTIKYGGNTSCIQIISRNNQFLILDSGTGIRELGMYLTKEKEPLDINIFLSHTHADHINGFPFFEPAFIEGNTINIYGPIHYEKSLADIMAKQMDYSYFPITTAQLSAKINYFEIKEEQLKIGCFDIETKYMNHPVLCLGYKIKADNKTVLYTGDTEPYYNFLGSSFDEDEDPEAIVKEENARMINFVKGTDLLICDAQYTDEEYKLKKGWGHSHIAHDLEMARKASVNQVAFFHHDPLHTDKILDEIVESAKEDIQRSENNNIKVFAAKEKEEIEL